jgi:superfamily I DNA/RNA helicase
MNETWWVAQEQLDEAQATILALSLDKSYLVLGPPGSGKTNLLLLRANYAYLAGQQAISIVVFTRTLQEFLRAGANQYDFPAQKIVTSVRWMTDLLLDFGKAVPDFDEFEALRRALLSAVKELIEEKDLGKMFDVILLDEAQDYWQEELEMFHRLATRLFVVADSRQKIYKGSESIAYAKTLVDQIPVLSHHYRNGIRICKLADAIAKENDNYEAMEPTAQYDESARPSSVEVHKCDGMTGQIAKIL